MEYNADDDEYRLVAGRLMFHAFLINYLNKKRKNSTKSHRVLLSCELNFKAKEFKIYRIRYKKKETDINNVLKNIKYNYDSSIVPIKQSLESYNKERIMNDHSYSYLMENYKASKNLLKMSSQMNNVLKVLNSGLYLNDLKDIKDVYSNYAFFPEEIVKFNDLKFKTNNVKNEKNLITEDSSSSEDFNEKGIRTDSTF